jgi:hypothetical protein
VNNHVGISLTALFITVLANIWFREAVTGEAIVRPGGNLRDARRAVV